MGKPSVLSGRKSNRFGSYPGTHDAIPRDARRHPQLKERLGRTPPERATISLTAERQPEKPSAPKPPSLAAWHFDPQLFRKWPQFMADSGGEGEHRREQESGNEVSLGL
jgi:hypothetical protein